MLVGKHKRMSLAKNTTFDLWRSFMQERKTIKNYLSQDLFSIQVYEKGFDFRNFDPMAEFEKWASVEVKDHENIPEGMDPFILEGGLYAVFIHRGPASTGDVTFRYIFGEWLPASAYLIDDRPHFEILGAKYNHEDPASEEEVWIPVRLRRS